MDGPKDKLDSVLNFTVIVTFPPNKSLFPGAFHFHKSLVNAQGEHTWSCRSRGLWLYGWAAVQTERVGTLTPVITMGKALCREQTILESPLKKKNTKKPSQDISTSPCLKG